MASRTIVFGDDRSANADRAWLWILNQTWPGWDIEAVTALPDAADLTSNDLPARPVTWQPKPPRRVFADSGIRKLRHERSGADAGIALRHCSEAGLLVVGSRGTHGLKRALVGSTTGYLLEDPPLPLVVAATSDPAHRILVCTDGSPYAQRAVEVLAQLPLAATARKIEILSVDDRPPRSSRDREEGLRTAAETLAHLGPQQRLVACGLSVASTIVDRARSSGANLIVVGHRGSSMLRRLLHTSTVHGVVRAAPCAILVVPGVGHSQQCDARVTAEFFSVEA